MLNIYLFMLNLLLWNKYLDMTLPSELWKKEIIARTKEYRWMDELTHKVCQALDIYGIIPVGLIEEILFLLSILFQSSNLCKSLSIKVRTATS